MTAVADQRPKQSCAESLPSVIRHYIDGEHVDSADAARPSP